MRTSFLIGEEGVNKLKKSKVVLFGIGGVGSYVLEGLVRAGIGNIILVDSDIVDTTNLNRQIIATYDTIGKDKVEVAKERALSINKNINVQVKKVFFDKNSGSDFNFDDVDYIVDAIDYVQGKIKLVLLANRYNIPIISCMGTGNKLDPTKFEVSDISKTSVCPLARTIRKELKKHNISKLKVVYSKEEPIKFESDLKVPGSISFVPSVAGLIIAGEVIKDILKKD